MRRRAWSASPARSGQAEHGHTPATPDLHELLVAEFRVGAEHRLHIDLQRVRQVPGRRQPFPRGERTRGQRPADLLRDLLVKRGRRTGIYSDQHDLNCRG